MRRLSAMLLPLLLCLRLNNRAIIHRLHTTLEKS